MMRPSDWSGRSAAAAALPWPARAGLQAGRAIAEERVPRPGEWTGNTPSERDRVRQCYDGGAGLVLRFGSLLSLHEPLIGRLIAAPAFGLRERRSILDIGVGAGQILRHLLAGADPAVRVTAVDLSTRMLLRTRRGLASDRPAWFAADIAHLPFDEGAFDCVTCGWVLEYQNDPRVALAELRRVLEPDGRLLVLATDDTFAGRLVGRIWFLPDFHG